MLIRKIAVENVRSFLDRQELTFDGPISIIIGPNGGGKTNLLDTIVTMLRRYPLPRAAWLALDGRVPHDPADYLGEELCPPARPT